MKLITSTLLLLAAVAKAEHRGLATLAEKWNITDPVFDYKSLSFELDHEVTDFIVEQQGTWSLYTAPSCKEGGTLIKRDALNYFNEGINADDVVFKSVVKTDIASELGRLTGDNKGRHAILNVTLDPEEISTSSLVDATTADPFYREYMDGTTQMAEIRFCSRFSLWTGPAGADNIEVNFLETLVTLTVDLTDGFTIGEINVEPKDKVAVTANQAYEVEGFLCGANNAALVEPELSRNRNQGEVVKVCVQPNDEAQGDGIYMRSIDSFTFSRGAVEQEAIVAGTFADNLLTTYTPATCPGTLVCSFETLLRAGFYTSVGSVAGSGVASMQFGSQSRRGLRASDSARQLQEEEVGAGEFELDFSVNQVSARNVNSGAASLSAMAAVAISMAAAMIQ